MKTEDVFASAPILQSLMEQGAIAWYTENLFPQVAGKCMEVCAGSGWQFLFLADTMFNMGGFLDPAAESCNQ